MNDEIFLFLHSKHHSQGLTLTIKLSKTSQIPQTSYNDQTSKYTKYLWVFSWIKLQSIRSIFECFLNGNSRKRIYWYSLRKHFCVLRTTKGLWRFMKVYEGLWRFIYSKAFTDLFPIRTIYTPFTKLTLSVITPL